MRQSVESVKGSDDYCVQNNWGLGLQNHKVILSPVTMVAFCTATKYICLLLPFQKNWIMRGKKIIRNPNSMKLRVSGDQQCIVNPFSVREKQNMLAVCFSYFWHWDCSQFRFKHTSVCCAEMSSGQIPRQSQDKHKCTGQSCILK